MKKTLILIKKRVRDWTVGLSTMHTCEMHIYYIFINHSVIQSLKKKKVQCKSRAWSNTKNKNAKMTTLPTWQDRSTDPEKLEHVFTTKLVFNSWKEWTWTSFKQRSAFIVTKLLYIKTTTTRKFICSYCQPIYVYNTCTWNRTV